MCGHKRLSFFNNSFPLVIFAFIHEIFLSSLACYPFLLTYLSVSDNKLPFSYYWEKIVFTFDLLLSRLSFARPFQFLFSFIPYFSLLVSKRRTKFYIHSLYEGANSPKTFLSPPLSESGGRTIENLVGWLIG